MPIKQYRFEGLIFGIVIVTDDNILKNTLRTYGNFKGIK